MPWNRKDFDIDRGAFARCCLVDGGGNFFEMLGFCGGFSLANLAVESPKIHALWQRFFALAFDIFSHIALDLLNDAGRLMVRRGEGKCLFHLTACVQQRRCCLGEVWIF